ncbi:MAG TPA: hypothetical protein VI818_03885 [Candidatus Thermoplasmatota archaeon]|nr:hypothetical protein [Candidatus Thermoplasmatota archaeon]
MTAPDSSANTDWRPFVATGFALGAALALNLLTHNSLWFWYTVLGLGILLTVAGATNAYRLRPPRQAVWGVGITASLHYVGGSLSGLHQIGGPNGLYYAFPWWDNVVHALGSGAIAMAAHAFLATRIHGSRPFTAFLAVCVASFVGVLVELYEFAQFVFLGTVDQGFYTNTVLDLYYNLLGATLGAVAYARATRHADAALLHVEDVHQPSH